MVKEIWSQMVARAASMPSTFSVSMMWFDLVAVPLMPMRTD
jgi:hypothetical protein